MNSYNNVFYKLANLTPKAKAEISGGIAYPNIKGEISFYSLANGVVVCADIEGLPESETNIFAFHIHEGEDCENNFLNTAGHYNPQNTPHPRHAGDLPPLFSNAGESWLCFYTARFNVAEIIGKTIVIHAKPDDFTSQPAGNSGDKIACGVIKSL